MFGPVQLGEAIVNTSCRKTLICFQLYWTASNEFIAMKSENSLQYKLCNENNEVLEILPPKNDLYLMNKQIDDFFSLMTLLSM